MDIEWQYIWAYNSALPKMLPSVACDANQEIEAAANLRLIVALLVRMAGAEKGEHRQGRDAGIGVPPGPASVVAHALPARGRRRSGRRPSGRRVIVLPPAS